MNGKIDYGFGQEYLPNWTIKEAIREVFQNYIDYGEYNIFIEDIEDTPNYIKVRISNNYIPNKLEFLRIGNTDKGNNSNAIGHHGEGLKVAFLIFLREKLLFQIWTPELVLNPRWNQDVMIGETLAIEYSTNASTRTVIGFDTYFECPRNVYEEFIKSIVTDNDIAHSCSYGDMLWSIEPKGRIYSGNLYVCTIKDLDNSYNIKPSYLPLDRDRSVPRDFDLDWAIAQIITSFNNRNSRLSINHNYNSRDYKYVSNINEDIASNFKSTKVGKNIEFIDKTTNEILKNDNIKQALLRHPKFKKVKKTSRRVIFLAKQRLAEKKSVKALLNTFKQNYCNNQDMLDDINIIIKKL